MSHKPTHAFSQFQDRQGAYRGVCAVNWNGPILDDDMYWALEAHERAHQLAGSKMTSLSLIGEAAVFPDLKTLRKMGDLQPLLSAFQLSAHLVVSKSGQRAKTAILAASAYFMRGTGGMLFVHASLNEALDKATALGHLHIPHEELIAWLSRMRFPVA